MKFEVAILAGGQGTRLGERSLGLPKPMVPVSRKPLLQHHVELCRDMGFNRILLLVHYKSDAIRTFFGDGEAFGVNIGYQVEAEARGTAGALRDALGKLAERFLVLYGDTYIDVNLRRIWEAHKRQQPAATLVLHPNDHPHDSDLVEIGHDGAIVAIHPYPHPEEEIHKNLVNAALYVLERESLADVIPQEKKSDLAKNTFPAMLKAGLRLQAYVTPEYIKDMGTPDRLDKVEHDIEFGVPERLSSRQLHQAVFIDRDGTLNVEVDHLRSPSQLKLLPGVTDALRALNRSGVLAVCVTNQPVVARGDVSWETLRHIHAALDTLLGRDSAYLDGLYVCPHHPDRGFSGEVPELKIECECRKPRTGLIDRAVEELGIDRRQSWMIGDSTADIRAGVLAGLRTILVRTGYAGFDGKYGEEPDYIMPTLSDAVDWILRGYAEIARQVMPASAVASKARVVLVGGPARAGKSCVARVMAEQISLTGRMAHVFELDGWLRPVERRLEGHGVLARYDMQAFSSLIEPLLQTTSRHRVRLRTYERKTRETRASRLLSVGPDDLIIVEGVPAFMDPKLCSMAEIRMYVDVDDEVRRRRLLSDYSWRGDNRDDIDTRLSSREADELPAVRASAAHANYHILGN